MTIRIPVLRALAAVALFACGPANAAAACETPLWLTFTVTAGAASPGSDRDTVVRVHDDGCTDVHRPAFLRDAGDWRVMLDAAAMADLRRQFDASGVQRFDAAQVKAALSTTAKSSVARPGSTAREVFAVLDADVYDVRWQRGKSEGAAAWTGLPAYADAYPDIAALRGFADFAASVQAIARRTDAVRVEGAAR